MRRERVLAVSLFVVGIVTALVYLWSRIHPSVPLLPYEPPPSNLVITPYETTKRQLALELVAQADEPYSAFAASIRALQKKSTEPTNPNVRILFIGVEGLNKHFLDFVSTRNFTVLPLDSGLSAYMTPELAWQVVRGGAVNKNDKAMPPFRGSVALEKSLDRKTPEVTGGRLFDILRKDHKLLLADVRGATKGDASPDLFIDTTTMSTTELQRIPQAFPTKGPLDLTSRIFEIIAKKSFDIAFIGVPEPDKTMHANLYGMLLMPDDNAGTIPQWLAANIKAMQSLESAYSEFLDYLSHTYANDYVMLFSLHGQIPGAWEFEMGYENEFFHELGIRSPVQGFWSGPVELTFEEKEIAGQQKALVLTTNRAPISPDNEPFPAYFSYLRWTLSLEDSESSYTRRLIKKIDTFLAGCTVDSQPIYRSGIDDDGHLIIDLNYNVVETMLNDNHYRYPCGLTLTRVQGHHPGSAPGVLLIKPPKGHFDLQYALPANRYPTLFDIAPTAAAISGADPGLFSEGMPVFRKK